MSENSNNKEYIDETMNIDAVDDAIEEPRELAETTFDVASNEVPTEVSAEASAEVPKDEHPDDTVVERGLRKLNPKFKNKAEKKEEREALSELEGEDYVPEEHESVYDIAVDKKIYSNNYAMAAFLLLFGFIVWPYSRAATGLLVFYGCGVAWMAYKGIKTKIHVDGTTFTVEGTKYPGTYTFDDVEKMIYIYNKKYQRRYYIHVDGKRICEIPPGAQNSRWLYDDMMAYGVPGGWYNKL